VKKGTRTLVLVAAFVLLASLISSCGNRSKKDFNRLLVELAADDGVIDGDDWHRISDYLDSQKTHFSEFYDGEAIDIAKVKSYVNDMFARRRPAKEIQFIGVGADGDIDVSFYLERSGSMIGYDSPDGDGSFKQAIVKMLNSLPGNNDDYKIYVVNDGVNEYPEGVSKFLADNNIFGATKGIGDASYTDFGAIFRQLIDKTKQNELAILVTDMIYSTRDMAGINAQKVFAEAQGMTNAVFKGKVKDMGMLIVKMNSTFSGMYYPYNSPKGGKQWRGRRPYYFVVVGSNSCFERLQKDKHFAPFVAFDKLRGYENLYLFSGDGVYDPYFTFMLSGRDLRGRFEPERGQGEQIKNLKNIKPDRDSGDLRLHLAVDLSGMFVDESYATDPKNYVVSSDDDIKIEEIRRIDPKEVSPAARKYVGSATHIFVLKGKEVSHEQELSIKLLNRLPLWVEASSSDDDTTVGGSGFADTTFGLKYLLQGIYDSYKRLSEGEPYYFEMKMKLKN